MKIFNILLCVAYTSLNTSYCIIDDDDIVNKRPAHQAYYPQRQYLPYNEREKLLKHSGTFTNTTDIPKGVDHKKFFVTHHNHYLKNNILAMLLSAEPSPHNKIDLIKVTAHNNHFKEQSKKGPVYVRVTWRL